jgi:pSer/pThr/pTyr-binding forkhead associated (FHA) protein
MTIGRAERCDLTIYDDAISRRHCRIERPAEHRFIIVDEGSRNGVRVRRLGPDNTPRKRSRALLRLGYRIELGDTDVTPVDALTRVPIVAYRVSEFMRGAEAAYGGGSMMRRLAGFGASLRERLTGGRVR